MIDDFTKKRCLETKRVVVSTSERIFQTILQFAAIALCAASIMFVDKDYSKTITYSILGAFVLVEAIILWNTYRLTFKVDNIFLSDASMVKKENYWNYYENYVKLKSKAISFPSGFVSSLLICVLSVAILLMNSLSNYVYIITAIGTALVRYFFAEPKLRENSRIVANNEKSVKNSENLNDFLLNSKKCKIESSHFVKKYSLFRFIESFILVIAPFVMTSVTNTYSTPYVVLYLSMEIFLTKAFRDVLKGDSDKNEYNHLVSKHMSYIK